MLKFRQQLRFYGRVQGVGFRYTAYHLANSLGLTGWVCNDFDGSVLMEIQGEKHSIQTLIEKLDSSLFIEIENIEKKDLPVVEFERSFEIKY